MARSKKPIAVETLRHEDATRKNIPTAEYRSVLDDDARDPVRVAYERRDPDLDPQLVWRGKDVADWSDLVVHAPPLYIQEKVHPKALIDELLRETREKREGAADEPLDLFADFNGIPEGADLPADSMLHSGRSRHAIFDLDTGRSYVRDEVEHHLRWKLGAPPSLARESVPDALSVAGSTSLTSRGIS
ncbi:MAG TPA: hypothetical protein VF190_08330 [Rhodothermales bacterium]